MRYHDIHCRLTDKEYERLRDMVNGGAISPFIRRQIFLGTDWSRILEIKGEIQKIRTELVRGNRVGSLETAIKENNEILNELDRKLDQLIYLQKAAQATLQEPDATVSLQEPIKIVQGFEAAVPDTALQGSECAVSGTARQGAEAKVPLQGIENRNEGGKQWQ